MTTLPPPDEADCPRCLKPAILCVCEGIVPLDNRIALLVLQHPQEQDRALGTARLAAFHLTQAQFRVGLSWPSLVKALGQPADARRWAVLYLGSATGKSIDKPREVVAVDRKGAALADQERGLADVDGIVVLDGSWSQAKALWWRNPWLLKLRRIVLTPNRPSRYGKLRREPRRDSLSTIESVALALSRLEHRPDIETAMMASFERLLARYRATTVTESRLHPDAKR